MSLGPPISEADNEFSAFVPDLERAAEKILLAPDHLRKLALGESAHALAGLVREGGLRREAVRLVLLPPALEVGLTMGEVDGAIAAAFNGSSVAITKPAAEQVEDVSTQPGEDAATTEPPVEPVGRTSWELPGGEPIPPPSGDLATESTDGELPGNAVAVLPPSAADANDSGDEGTDGSGTQASQLVTLARSTELFHDRDGEPFATCPVGEKCETYAVRSVAYRQWLLREWYHRRSSVPGSQAVTAALGVIEAHARYDGPTEDVFVRIGERQGAIYLDLANDGDVVEIAPSGWRILSHAPVKFRRPRGMRSLPRPVRGGGVDLLNPFLNFGSEDARRLFITWLVAAIWPKGPYPLVVINGEQGSAKSTGVRIARELTDPNAAGLRSEPREARDLMIAATNCRVLAYDNLSHVPPWLSDAFCRLATGGGFATRALYSDADEVIFNAQRPVIMNGIEDLATRSDLLDRAIVLTLFKIQECRDELEFWAAFEQARPVILGALLDAVSAVMRELPRVQIRSLPRMADFTKIGVAAARSLGWEPEDFLRAYEANRDASHEVALEASPIAEGLLKVVAERESWDGTASELLRALEMRTECEPRRRGWPGNARALSSALRRIAPNLRARGIDVDFQRTGNKRFLVIKKSAACVISVTSVTDPIVSAVEGAHSDEPAL